MLPNLEKFQSMLDVPSTLKLVNQAYDIVFKELQTFVDFAQKFDGISWKVFVRLTNRFRKTGTYIKPDNILFGEDVPESRPFGMDIIGSQNDYG